MKSLRSPSLKVGENLSDIATLGFYYRIEDSCRGS